MTTRSPRDRFLASLILDQERWREGEGYDLAALDQCSAAERAEIETTLLERGVTDWRDVAALARLGTPTARAALTAVARSRADGPRLCGALLTHAADLFDEEERRSLLAAALRRAESYDGLDAALEMAPHYRGPEVEAALFKGCLEREPEDAVSFAAMLLHLHGVTDEPFDDAERPFLLRFSTDDRAARRAALRDLRARLKAGR